MDVKRILLPYNFTDLDKKALAFVCRTFSHLPGTEVTLLNVYMPVPVIAVQENPVMKKMQESIAYMKRLIADQEGALDQAKEQLVSGGFTENRVRVDFKPKNRDVAGHIIDTATRENHDLVVLTHSSGKIGRFFTGNVFNKVVTGLRGIAICIVT